ncbi:hypothetical protein [Rickettsiella grylli]|uniref:Uncharacterized protein n=1 Tax=Rickettsiella grylli TaxID=59196 RepID=A8PLW0_9COXI|nr:hypothetical protein [Rickettsiella grylli]EDP46552.1 conserved hypothetical protein [Rickettsiella grylli]
MREYGSVQTQFWSDLALQNLSTHAKLLAVYLLTGPHTNMLGCFRLPIGYVAEDLKWNGETVYQVFSELSQVKFLIRDTESNWILITHFLDWNPIENPNQGKSLSKLFKRVPTQSMVFRPLIVSLLAQNKHLDEGFKNHLATLSQPFQNQEQNQEQDQNQEKDQEQDVVCKPSFIGGLPSSNSKIPLLINKKSVVNTISNEEIIDIPLQNNDVFILGKWISTPGRKSIQILMFCKSCAKYKLGMKLIQMHEKPDHRSCVTSMHGLLKSNVSLYNNSRRLPTMM